VAEQIRQIHTNLETVLAEHTSRMIVITSPIPGDGKTLVTANLATVLADDPNQRILLIDADMRKPDQHQLFGIQVSPGLSDYLTERNELEEVTYGSTIPNLDIIPAGRIPPKPTVLLSSERMSQITARFSPHYRWILIDTPPMLPVTDACLLARRALGMILVVRMGRTSRHLITRAEEMMAEMRLPVLGCILNEFTEHTRDNSYYYNYYGRPESSSGFKS
jgi:capsular exopolysaccharide synthesis family protein